MPNRRLFDSSSMVPPPEPRVEAMTSNRVLTPEEKEEASWKSARLALASVFCQHMTVPPMSARVGYTLMTEYRFRI